MSTRKPQPAKAMIVARGERISDVAEALGLGAPSLYGVLSGRLAPWPALTHNLATYLKVEPTDLWHDDSTVADAARQLVATTRRAQGLPDTVSDVAVLERVATIVASVSKEAA